MVRPHGGLRVELGGVQEDVDRGPPPPQSHLAFAPELGALVRRRGDLGRERGQHGISRSRIDEDVDVDVDGASGLLGAPCERESATECVRNTVAAQRLADRHDLVDDAAHGRRSAGPPNRG